MITSGTRLCVIDEAGAIGSFGRASTCEVWHVIGCKNDRGKSPQLVLLVSVNEPPCVVCRDVVERGRSLRQKTCG